MYERDGGLDTERELQEQVTPEFWQAAEDIEQHEADGIDAVDGRGGANSDSIEPAAAARAACDGTVFAADFADALADSFWAVIEFGGERA